MDDPGPGEERGLRTDPLGDPPTDFEAFFARENSGYLRYAQQRLRHREDAQDAVQSAGTTLYKNWPRALASVDPQAFAFKVVKDAVVDVLRERRRAERRRLRVMAQRRPDTSQDELDELAELDALDWAMDELARAAPIQADVVRLRREGLSYHDIGRELGIAHTTARTCYSLGRRHLDYLLEHPDEGGAQA